MDSISESVKITLIGNSGVGKTCIIQRYTLGQYDDNSSTTRGANYSFKTIIKNDKKIKLDLWDTAGQEQYRSLGKHFYKDSYIVILVYDITNLDSFNDLKNIWYQDLIKYGEKYNIIAIVGNKCDLYEQEAVKEEEAREFANSINSLFMLVSAKNGDNINSLFEAIIDKYLEPEFSSKVEEMKERAEGSMKIRKPKSSEEKKYQQLRKKGCC